MTAPQSRLLLVNFDIATQVAIEALGLMVDVGYLGHGGKDSLSLFHSPFALHEYSVILVQLVAAPTLEQTLLPKAHRLTTRVSDEFAKYWGQHGVLVVFLGDTPLTDLRGLGLNTIQLVPPTGKDRTVISAGEKSKPFAMQLERLHNEIVMPPRRHIANHFRELPDGQNWCAVNIFQNRDDSAIGAYISATSIHYLDRDDPRLVILPTFRDPSRAIATVLRSIANLSSWRLPELRDGEWANGVDLYPACVREFDDAIDQSIQEAKSKQEALRADQETAKNKYGFLRALLTTSGDELKAAVLTVLNEILDCQALDADLGKKTRFAEDIKVEYDGGVYLIEVKGTRAKNPPQKYIAQAFGNALKSGIPDVIPGLYCNHDLLTHPDARPAPYSDTGDENLLDEIVFVDTRVLHSIALAVIDLGLSPDIAKKTLFARGRVEFNGGTPKTTASPSAP